MSTSTWKKEFLFVLFLLFFLFVLLTHARDVKAFGAAPAGIDIGDLLRQNEYSSFFTVTRPRAEEDIWVTGVVQGFGAEYVLLPEKRVMMKKGAFSAPFPYKVVPLAAANGRYSVEFTFMPQAVKEAVEQEQEGVKVNVVVGSLAKLYFTVSDHETKKVRIDNAASYDTEIGKPIVFAFTLFNEGNVDAHLDKIDFIVRREKDASEVMRTSLEKTDIVASFGEKQLFLNFPHTLEIGFYTLEVSYWFNGEEIPAKRKYYTRVFPPGTLEQLGSFISIKTDRSEYMTGDLIKFDATFQNTGKIMVTATLNAEISKGGKFMDFLTTEVVSVNPGESATFTLVKSFEKGGSYEAKSYITYGAGRRTEEKYVNFTIQKTQSFLLAGGLITVSVLFGGGLWLMHRLQRSKKSKLRKKQI